MFSMYNFIISFLIVLMVIIIVINTPLINVLEQLLSKRIINDTFLLMKKNKIENTISCRKIYRKMNKYNKTKQFLNDLKDLKNKLNYDEIYCVDTHEIIYKKIKNDSSFKIIEEYKYIPLRFGITRFLYAIIKANMGVKESCLREQYKIKFIKVLK